MATPNHLREELLKQAQTNGAGAGSIQEILAKDEAAVRRMKKLTTVAWLLVLAFLITGAAIEAILRNTLFLPVAIVVLQALFLIAVSFTVSWHVRSRTLTMHQIQARLSTIEMLLKKVMQEK